MLTEIATKEGATKRGIVDALVSEYYREFHAQPITEREQAGTKLQGLQDSRSYEPSGGPTHTAARTDARQNGREPSKNRRDENVVFDL